MTVTNHEANTVLRELNTIIIENEWEMLNKFITPDEKRNMVIRLLQVAERARAGPPRPS